MNTTFQASIDELRKANKKKLSELDYSFVINESINSVEEFSSKYKTKLPEDVQKIIIELINLFNVH